MKNQVVAERYAQALFQLAKEQRQEAKFGGILDDILAMMKEHPDFEKLLHHPVVKKEDKKQMMTQLFAGKIPDQLLHFLCLLVDKHREDHLDVIAAEYTNLLNASNKTVITDVVTAVPMFKKTEAILKQQLEDYLGQQVVMNCHPDPDLLGGVTIKIGDRMIDGSLKTQLNNLAQALV